MSLETTLKAGFVRAEVRGSGHLAMEGLTNPIRLVTGDRPADARPETAPPPPRIT